MSPEAIIVVLVVLVFGLVFYIQNTKNPRPKDHWKDWQ